MALGFTWDAAKSAANVRKHGVSFEDASTPPAMSGRPMKKISKAKRTSDGMRVEYDFSGGVRGKYAARYRAGTNVVMLDPDVAATFKDAEAVNRALRAIIAVVPVAHRRPRRARSV